MYRLLTNQERVKFIREAADVERIHTIRRIGEYCVGKHSFNMLAMLRLLWPEAPLSLVWAIVEHDIPERVIGDIPSPSIRNVLTESHQQILHEEMCVLEELFGRNFCYYGLPEDQMKWLKALDKFELYLYTRDQARLGNRNLKTMQTALEEFFKKHAKDVPSEVLDLFYECKNSDWNFLPDLGA